MSDWVIQNNSKIARSVPMSREYNSIGLTDQYSSIEDEILRDKNPKNKFQISSSKGVKKRMSCSRVTLFTSTFLTQQNSTIYPGGTHTSVQWQELKKNLYENESKDQRQKSQSQRKIKRPTTTERLMDRNLLSIEEEKKEIDDDLIEIKAINMEIDDPDAVGINHTIYKNLETVLEKKQFYTKGQMSAFTGMLKSSCIQESQGEMKRTQSQGGSRTMHVQAPLMPRNFGIIGGNSFSRKNHSLNVNFFGVGDKYAKILGAGLQNEQLKTITQVSVKNNGFSLNGVKEITKSLQSTVSGLNLQGNKIGQITNFRTNELQQINKKFANLQELNLENNNFNDKAAQVLLLELTETGKIKKLNLSQNKISDDSSQVLRDFIVQAKFLTELYLHWNKLNAISGRAIAKALQQNQNIQVLDLSYNTLGGIIKQTKKSVNAKDKKILQAQTIEIKCAEFWAEYFRSNSECSLSHLDLSYNSFSLDDCDVIAEGLQNNHGIYGFHFQGNGDNGCYVDGNGFLIIPSRIPDFFPKLFIDHKAVGEYIPGVLQHRRIDGVKQLPRLDISQQTCWICNGWVEQKITWDPMVEFKGEPVFVHFSHERFVPVMMQKENLKKSADKQVNRRTAIQFNTSQWTVKRMFPPHQVIKFFFTCPITKQVGVSKCHTRTSWTAKEQSKKVIFFASVGDKIKTISFHRPHSANVIYIGGEQQIISISDFGSYTPVINSIPRDKNFGGILTVTEEQLQTQEKVDESSDQQNFFSEGLKESDSLYDECFDHDWNKSVIPSLIKTEDDAFDVKNYLRTVYEEIVSAYRTISALSPNGDIFCISLNAYTEFFQPVLSPNKYQLKDLDLQFKQCTARHKQSVRPQAQLALIRFQFLEIIVRIAIDKYNKDNNMTVFQCLKKLYDEDELYKKIEQYDTPQEWRDDEYWEDDQNTFIQKYMKVFQQLYDQAYKFRVLNYFTSLKFVTPTAFKDFFSNAGLMDMVNGDRGVYVAYNQSVIPVKDEITSDRPMQMNFYEFVEALFRIADKIDLSDVTVSDESFDADNAELKEKMKFLITKLGEFYNITLPEEEKDSDIEDGDGEQILQKQNDAFRKFLARNTSLLNFEMEPQPQEKIKKKKKGQ